jgi:hypothetical protein
MRKKKTDDWHTGGHPIEDWAFGITYADRTPKPSFRAVENVFNGNQAATRGGSGSYIGPSAFPYDVYDFTENRKRDGPV